jgi:hypothetical protein
MNRCLACLVVSLLVFSSPLLAVEFTKVEPVAPQKPIPDKAVAAFQQQYGEELKKAAASPEAVGELAAKIFAAVEKGGRDADFDGYALDQVLLLASPQQGRQQLAYAALRTQWKKGWRPEAGCIEKVMALGPRVLADLPAAERAKWLQDAWCKDAVDFASVALQARKYDQALAYLTAVSDAAKAGDLALPGKFTANFEGLEFVKKLNDQLGQYETDVKDGSATHPQAHIATAILALCKAQDPKTALAELKKASGQPAASELAAAMEAETKVFNKPELMLRTAAAMEALAGKAENVYFQILLWDAAAAKSDEAVKTEKLVANDKARATLLKERVNKKSADALAKLPMLVQYQFTGLPVRGHTGGAVFFGLSMADAQRVVYVVDHSGSMADTIQFVKAELMRSINSLAVNQPFAVYFYSSGPALFMKDALVEATPAGKKAAADFIKAVAPIGQTDPSDALRRAFALKPDVIFLLTDGEFEPKISGLIDQLNAGHKTKVNTFCFIYTSGEALLKQIASRNGGAYKFVDESDLTNLGK